METIFTSDKSRTRIITILRAKSFGGRTRCRHCGYTRKHWKIGDRRWKCKRCRKKFGILTNSPLARVRFSLREFYELLHWFELGLTDRKIAGRIREDYHRVHRFFMTVREALAEFEEKTINVLDNKVEVDERRWR